MHLCDFGIGGQYDGAEWLGLRGFGRCEWCMTCFGNGQVYLELFLGVFS